MFLRTVTGQTFKLREGTEVLFLDYGSKDHRVTFITEDNAVITLFIAEVERVFKH